MTEKLEKRIEAIEALANKMGLDYFPVVWEEVPREIIWEVASYGLPTRMSHWSFGRSFLHQKLNGEMGYGKIYELIVNSNPSYAFLDDTNSDVANLLIAAHCYVPGTYIQTQDGAKLIEDILPGDIVFNQAGSPTRVRIPTKREYRGPVVTIGAGSYNFTQTPEHKLLVVRTDPNDRKKFRSWKNAFDSLGYEAEWVCANDIKCGDFLVVDKPKLGSGRLRHIDIPIRKTLWRQNIRENKHIILDKGFGLLIGLYLAEGYATLKGHMGLCFHKQERKLHKLGSKLVKRYFGLDTMLTTNHDTHSTVVGFNEICIANYLRNMVGTKCYLKSIPQAWMKDAPKDFLEGILVGFMYGDGDKMAPRSLGYSSTSSKLAIQIQQIAMSNGIYFGLNNREMGTKIQPRRMAFVGKCAGDMDNAMRKLLRMEPRRLSRSWNSIIRTDSHFYVKVKKVSAKPYVGYVHCMEVEDGASFSLLNGIITHNCIGHSAFFKKNICFAKTNRNMVNQAERNAKIIDEYKSKYGTETVEDWMDVAFALDRHIDVPLGENRQKYPDPEIVSHEVHPLPYADLFGESMKPHMIEELKNIDMPPHPERDILWFLANYAQMLPWQREVISIIRSESFYFYPQAITKIMNEGFACWTHAELMLNYDGLSPDEHLDFSKIHASVVNPGSPGSINPYYVGFKILTDIKARWDKYYEAGLKDAAFLASPDVDQYDEHGNVVLSKMTGMQKIFRVMEEDDDVSFVKNYLTRELAEEMELFTYGQRGAHVDPEMDDIIIKDRQLHVIHEAITSRLHNYGMPLIYISKIQSEDDGLVLVHDRSDGRPLDEHYTKETLKYIFRIWRKPVLLHTYDRFGKDMTYKHSEGGSSCERSASAGKQIHLRM